MTDLQYILYSLKKDVNYKEDNLYNHLLTSMSRNRNYSGVVDENGFTIWRYSGLMGIFYPIIKGKIVDFENSKKLKISTKINKSIFVLVLPFFLPIFSIIYQSIEYKQSYDGSYYYWYIDWLEIIQSFSFFLIVPIIFLLYSITKRNK